MDNIINKTIIFLEKQKEIIISQNIPPNSSKEYLDDLLIKIKKIDDDILYYHQKLEEIKKGK